MKWIGVKVQVVLVTGTVRLLFNRNAHGFMQILPRGSMQERQRLSL